MTLDQRYPAIVDLEAAAYARIPRFASEYLRGGVGSETGLQRNQRVLSEITFSPRYLAEKQTHQPNLQTTILDQTFALPFGISPIGLSGLMWPKAVAMLARSARRANIPMGLSTFATTCLSDFHATAKGNGWFQMYTANTHEKRRVILEDVKRAGFEVLIVTIDVPTYTRRPRELKVGLSVPPVFNMQTAVDVIKRPRWALATAAAGLPRFKNVLPYVPQGLPLEEEAREMNDMIDGTMTYAVLQEIRDLWPGKLLVKGVLSEVDALQALKLGADGLWVSNHGGRQLDAALSPVEVLPRIRDAVGDDVLVVADSGVRSGLDIARMLACGADFVFLGRAFMYAVCALQEAGPDHAIHILQQELFYAMAQMGCTEVAQLSEFLNSKQTSTYSA